MTTLRIISGGQTGADRAALDAALSRGVPCGGWCPAGRRAEDGPIAARYPLTETVSADYAERTLANIRDSDGTLLLYISDRSSQVEALSPGTRFTAEAANASGRPLFIANLERGDTGAGSIEGIIDWIGKCKIRVLNIAGPRESECPGIYAAAYSLVLRMLAAAGGQ